MALSLTELSVKYNTRLKCIAHLEKVRWVDGVRCTHCDSDRTTKRKHSIKHHCNNCNRDFTVLMGTIFEYSKLPLPKWFQIIFLMLNAKKGISSMQLSRDVGVTQTTAWYTAMRIRCAMLDWGEQLEGILEMDESYVGGKPRKRNYISDPARANLSKLYKRTDEAVKRGRGTKKVPIAGVVSRQGKVVAKVMEDLRAMNLISLLKKSSNIERSVLITDDFSSYNKMDDLILRYVINHSKKEYARGAIHTNTIEGFWSIIKNGIKGQYHVLSKKYLPFYLAEYCYRYNRRMNGKDEAFDETVDNAVTNQKCFTDYKPKGDVKCIVYPRKKKTKEAVKRKLRRGGVLRYYGYPG